jgi:hypothetical protein
MMWQDLLAWAVGIGSLLYFGAAMVNPAWFLGEPPAEPVPPETSKETAPPRPIEEWHYLGQSH